MRNGAILFIMFVLTGCANFREVVDTIPEAAGTIAAAEVFGGEVAIIPDPGEYMTQDINREGRIIHGHLRRNTKAAISDTITKLFRSTK